MSAPDVRAVELIDSETLELLRARQGEHLHRDSKILLASVLFADSEGVAELHPGSLQCWCAMPGSVRASAADVNERIGHLVDVGALAPGSTATELRSMVGRAAEPKPKRARGRRGRRGGKSTTTTSVTAAAA